MKNKKYTTSFLRNTLLLLLQVGCFTFPSGRPGGAFAQSVYIVKGGPDTGRFTGGVFFGAGSKVIHASSNTNVVIDNKPGITEGSWKDATGITQSTTTLTKTASTGWGNAGAASNSVLDTLQNGWVQCKIDNLSNSYAFGLSNTNMDANYTSIQYAVMIDAGQMYVYNNGQLMGSYGAVDLNDSIRIEKIADIVYYTKNSVSLFNQQMDAKQPLLVDVAINTQGMVFELKASFGQAQTGCETAIPFTGVNSCMTNNFFNGNEAWYSFVGSATDFSIRLFDNSIAHHIGKVDWYEGNCHALILKGSFIEDSSATVGFTASNLINGTTYYLKVSRSSTCTSCTDDLYFDLCINKIVQSTCNSSASSCNLILNAGFEAGSIPTGSGGIRDNYVDCWDDATGSSAIGGNTPDVMDASYYCSSSSSCYSTSCSESSGGVGVPFNYYSNGQVFNRTSTSNRYACLFDGEVIRGNLSTTLTVSNFYYFEFWAATSSCYAAFPAQLTLSAPGVSNTDIDITNSSAPIPGNWYKYSACFLPVSGMNYFDLLFTGQNQHNSRYFFDDFRIQQLADAGKDTTICGGDHVQLGSPCPIDNASLTYNWSPTTGLSCSNCPNPIASPVVTTTYQVTVSGPSGCIDQDEVVITVNPQPNVTITKSPPGSICAGSGTNVGLYGNGADYYQWFPSGFFSTSITVSPNTTATYTVIGFNTLGCKDTALATVIVRPTPVILATPALQTVCSGTAIITINIVDTNNIPGTTYSWTRSNTNNITGISSSGTGQSISGTLINNTANTLTTTFTITAIANGCSSAPIAVSIAVKPIPTATAINSTQSVCSGTQTAIALTSTLPNTIFLWTVAQTGITGASSGTGNNITQTLTGSATGTAVYTITPTLNGCSGAPITATVGINSGNCCSPGIIALTGNISNFTGTGIGQQFYVSGTLTIDQNFTFNACNFIMAANAKIQVNSGKILTITNKTHLYSCTNMWDGIYVLGNALLNVNKNAFIEDATRAISIANTGRANVDSTIFNRNLTAIEIINYPSTISPLNLTRSVITSRSIPFFANVNLNPLAANVWTNIATYTTANLKGPYANIKGLYGVNASAVNLLNVGSAAAANLFNGFDAIMCGINLTSSNAIIYNNKFQNLLGYGTLQNPPPPHERGIGIKATGTLSGNDSLIVGDTVPNRANSFNNTYIAISATQYRINKIIGNSINNTTTGPFSIGAINYGYAGVYILNPSNQNIIKVCNQSIINNCETGIYVNRSQSSSLHTISLQINKNCNPTNNLLAGITSNGSGYCNTGIYVSDGGASTLSKLWEIKTNTITEAKNGIYLLHVVAQQPKAFYDVSDNICRVHYTSSGNTNGIAATGCKRLSITLNHTKCNSAAAAVFPTGNILTYGIYLQNSTNMLVKCNKIDSAARSMVFEGTCTSILNNNNNPTIGITQNTMHRAQDGFVLLNSGIIGTQGNASVASNNYWSAPFFNSQTFTQNTDSANFNSKLYMNSGVLTFPTNNKTNLGAVLKYSTTSGGLNISSGTPAACGAVRALMFSNNQQATTNSSDYSDELTTIEEDTTQLPVYNNESHWMRKHFVYNELKDEPSLNNNTHLQNFYNSSNHNYEKFAKVEDKIVDGQCNAANAINNTIVPTNIIESNQQMVNTLILNNLLNINYIYSSNDSAVLASIANQCPLSGGYGVYQARNLLMAITNQILMFDDNCSEQVVRSIEIIQNQQDSVGDNNIFKLYPNPNNGNMQLDYELNNAEKGTLVIVDAMGKKISEYTIPNDKNTLSINESTLVNGIYFYRITVNSKIIKSGKLLIIK